MSGLAYTVVGDEKAPGLLWLHGFLGSSADFEPFATRVGDRFRSFLFDLPAHGASTSSPPVSVEHVADTIHAIMRDNGVVRATVIGYSLGGRVALSLGSRHPRFVQSLLLESTSPGILGADARRRRRVADEALANRLETQSAHDFLRGWYGQSVFRSLRSDRRSLNRIIQTRRISSRADMAAALRSFSPGRQSPNWQALPTFSGKLGVVAGALDGKYVATGRRIANIVPNARLKVVPASGHVVHFESPEAYFQIVDSFLHDCSMKQDS